MNTFKLDSRVTSRSFREAVLTAFPKAEARSELLRLLLLLLLCPWIDGTGRTVLPYRDVAACGDASTQAESNNFDAKTLLNDFEANVLALGLWQPSWVKGLARTALPIWPPPVLAALDTELSMTREERQADAVYFVSGKSVKPRQHKEKLNMYKRKTIDELLPDDHPALELMQFANSQHAAVFRRLVENHIDDARAAVMTLEKRGKDGQLLPERTHATRLHAQRILHSLESDPMPIYKPSAQGTTSRIFADGLSYLGLPKIVRRALMPHCPELDLVNAQLAIAARDWDIPDVQTFLATGQKIWPALEAHFGLEPGIHKPVLKSTLYALLFGMPKHSLINHLAHGGPDEVGQGIGSEKAMYLFDHPLIQALYTAREQALAGLVTTGTAMTCFDQTLQVTDRKSARSALAAQAQARELWLLLPAVELMQATPDLKLVAWQHDGFTVHSSNVHKKDRYVRQLQQVVNERIVEGGYNTCLEQSA